MEVIKSLDILGDYVRHLEEDYEKLKKHNIQLMTNNTELREKIEKAIEYIKDNEFYLDYKTGACIKGVMPLLEILGDKK